MYDYCKIGGGAAALPPGWRYTIQTIELERRLINVNKDQYKIGKRLGSGAFGAVYSAKNTRDSKLNVFLLNLKRFSCRIDAPVAIKVVSLATFSTGEGQMLSESILTEIEMSKRLARASNHVVHMYDFDFDRQRGLAFLVMELGEKDLEKALKERSRLTPPERKEIWRQLIDIALVLHRSKIVI
jgi:serine/threonine protein kinase